MDDLMARFENLNTGPYARQPMEPRPENILVPDELSDRLEELRNPGKKQKEEGEYDKKMKAYLERYGDIYDFDEISLKKEELPLDTDVFSQAVKKIQRIERGRQSRKKYTKKKPIQKKQKKKKGKKKRYYGGTLTAQQLRHKRLDYLGMPRSDTSDSSNTRRLKEHFLTGIQEETHSSNFEPANEVVANEVVANEVVANEVVANEEEEFQFGSRVDWIPPEIEDVFYKFIVGTSDYPRLEDCKRLKEYCQLFPRTCYLNEKFLKEKVHVCREIVRTNNDLNIFFSSQYDIWTQEEREIKSGIRNSMSFTPHRHNDWEEIIEEVIESIHYDINLQQKVEIIKFLHELIYELFDVDYTNFDELQQFELYGYSTWIDVVEKLKGRMPSGRGELERLLYNFGIKLKTKEYPIELIENVKQALISLLKIYDI